MKRLSTIDCLNIAFLSIITIFVLSAFEKTPYKIPLIISITLLYFMLFFIIWFRNTKVKQKIKNAVLLLCTFVFLFGIFETFFMIIPYFNSSRYDNLMVSLDYSIFTFHPTVWIEQFITPWFTELMYILYLFYFLMPFFVIGFLYKKKQLKKIEEFLVIYLACNYSAYVIYFFVPVEGPRFILSHLQTIKLDGLFFSEPIRQLIDFLEPNKLDCFPSLHTAILLVVMFVSYNFARKLFYIFIPIAVGILISLVYLRYHYVVDIVAGLFLAIICFLAVRRIYHKINYRFKDYFEE